VPLIGKFSAFLCVLALWFSAVMLLLTAEEAEDLQRCSEKTGIWAPIKSACVQIIANHLAFLGKLQGARLRKPRLDDWTMWENAGRS
jgi:hypothetical protein